MKHQFKYVISGWGLTILFYDLPKGHTYTWDDPHDILSEREFTDLPVNDVSYAGAEESGFIRVYEIKDGEDVLVYENDLGSIQLTGPWVEELGMYDGDYLSPEPMKEGLKLAHTLTEKGVWAKGSFETDEPFDSKKMTRDAYSVESQCNHDVELLAGLQYDLKPTTSEDIVDVDTKAEEVNIGFFHDDGGCWDWNEYPVSMPTMDIEQARNFYNEEKFSKAFRIYKELAENGNAAAQHRLAKMFDDGDGVESDISQAIFWYQQAANQDYINSQWNLAECYRAGVGVKKSFDLAYFWFRKAATLGDSEAKDKLTLIQESIPQDDHPEGSERIFVVDDFEIEDLPSAVRQIIDSMNEDDILSLINALGVKWQDEYTSYLNAKYDDTNAFSNMALFVDHIKPAKGYEFMADIHEYRLMNKVLNTTMEEIQCLRDNVISSKQKNMLVAEIKKNSDTGEDKIEDTLSLIIVCIEATTTAGYYTYDGFYLELAGLVAQAIEFETIMHEDHENVPDGGFDNLKLELICNMRMILSEIKEYIDIGENRVESIVEAIMMCMLEIKKAGYYPHDDFELSLAGLFAQSLENGSIIYEDDVPDED